MYGKGITLALSLAILGGGGCTTPYSETPVATNFATTKQNKLQAGAHWKAIAEDLAKTIATKIPSGQQAYVAVPKKTAFNQAFFNEVLTALVNQGVSVIKRPAANAITVDIDTQLVKFGPNRPKFTEAGAPTALAGAAWVIHEIGPTWSTGQALAGAGVALVAADAYTWFKSENASGPVPTHEIFVTITASDSDRYIARTSSVYYVADSNADLYFAASNPKNIQLMGDR